MLPPTLPQEFMRPITDAWIAKLKSATIARQPWKDMADQCRMFYSQSAQAMTDASLMARFWKMGNVPKFRLPMNLAFEYVAVTLPTLLWALPHRDITPKIPDVRLGPEFFGGEESELWQFRQQELQQDQMAATAISEMLGDWLNYTPREQPGGGLQKHSELATLDMLLTGRGTQWTRPYTMPGSDKRLTKCEWESPDRMLVDPDYPTLATAKWISLWHLTDSYELEKRWQLPYGSLKDRGTRIESTWTRSEIATGAFPVQRFRDGAAKNMILWCEIWSKQGIGCRHTEIYDDLKRKFDEDLGDYVYLAIAPGIPYCLNCPEDAIRNGMTAEELKARFAWPVPLHDDNRWPVTCLDAYDNTNVSDPCASWPIAPLEPAMGEIQALNYIIPWIVNRTQETTRTFWLVAERYKEKLTTDLQREDLSVIGVPPSVDGDVRKSVAQLEQAQMNNDMWQVVSLIDTNFRRRTGMLLEVYGGSTTQSRVAEEAQQKTSRLNMRNEYLGQKVVAYQGELATAEAHTTRLYIRPEDVVGRYGQAGAQVWGQYVYNQDVEKVVRQFNFTISAASIRRPNRERDIANLQDIMAFWVAAVTNYASSSNDWQPLNGVAERWGKLHDMDVSGMLIPPPEPPDPAQQQMAQENQQLAQENAQLTNEELKAKIQKLLSDAEAKMIDAQVKAGTSMSEQQKQSQQLEMDNFKQQMMLAFDAQKHQQDIEQDAESHILDLLQDRQSFSQQLQQENAMGELKLDLARKQVSQKPKANGTAQGTPQ